MQVFKIIPVYVYSPKRKCHWTRTFRCLAKTRMALDARSRVALELTLFCRNFCDFHLSEAIVVQIPLKHLVEINHVAVD